MSQANTHPVAHLTSQEQRLAAVFHALADRVDQIGTTTIDAAAHRLELSCALAAKRLQDAFARVQTMADALCQDMDDMAAMLAVDLAANERAETPLFPADELPPLGVLAPGQEPGKAAEAPAAKPSGDDQQQEPAQSPGVAADACPADPQAGAGPSGQEPPVSIRDAQDAAVRLGDRRTEEIVGPGGLSGATKEQLRQLVDEARASVVTAACPPVEETAGKKPAKAKRPKRS